MAARALVEHFQAGSGDLLSVLEALVGLETPSGDAARIAAFVARYRGLLEAAGLRCRELSGPAGPHLFAEWPGAEPAVVLVGHSDTVWRRGEVVRRPLHVEGGKLHGPGVFDMKAGLVLIAALARCLAERSWRLRRRLQVFIAADEETGSITAHPHMDELLGRGATALVPEPPCLDGSLKIARKGVGIFRVQVRGREAHAGVDPEHGVNAVEEIARLVLELQSWNDASRGVLVNTGRIGGGTATNVVPGRAWCGVDVRFDRAEDGEALEARLRALRPRHPAAAIKVRGGIIFPPLVPTEASRRLSAKAIALAAEVGLDIGAAGSGGGSDGSYLASRGLLVLDGLGVDGGGAHSRNEHILIDRLPLRAAFLTLLVLALDGEPPG
jgi:glutamate carboxypeptidase